MNSPHKANLAGLRARRLIQFGAFVIGGSAIALGAAKYEQNQFDKIEQTKKELTQRFQNNHDPRVITARITQENGVTCILPANSARVVCPSGVPDLSPK